LKQIVPGFPKLKNAYTLLWDMPNNEGYINVVAMMQKYFDQAISGNWSYNPLQYENNEVPISAMAQDMLSAYKYGWKTSYYQNTYDFKGEEEDVQPAGIDVQPEPEQLNGVHINGDATVEEQLADLEDGECDACTI
jgi:ribonucleoside-diphosphate reductase alpha chain